MIQWVPVSANDEPFEDQLLVVANLCTITGERNHLRRTEDIFYEPVAGRLYRLTTETDEDEDIVTCQRWEQADDAQRAG